jgi:hypothetical protein
MGYLPSMGTQSPYIQPQIPGRAVQSQANMIVSDILQLIVIGIHKQ